ILELLLKTSEVFRLRKFRASWEICGVRLSSVLAVGALTSLGWAVPLRAAQPEPASSSQAFTWPDDPVVTVAAPLVEFSVGARTWVSFGQSTISVAGPNGSPDVLSELKWTRLVNPIVEFNAETLWLERIVAELILGFGTAGSGRLRDQDFDGDGRT